MALRSVNPPLIGELISTSCTSVFTNKFFSCVNPLLIGELISTGTKWESGGAYKRVNPLLIGELISTSPVLLLPATGRATGVNPLLIGELISTSTYEA